MRMAPPEAPPTWRHSAADIALLTQEAIEEYLNAMNKVSLLALEDCNFDSVFYAIDEAEKHLNCVTNPLIFYRHVSPVHEISDASYNTEVVVRNVVVETTMRVDIFNCKLAAKKNIKNSGRWNVLSSEEKQLVEKMVLDGTRSGLALPEEERKKITTLNQQLSQLCLEINRNFSKENGSILFTKEELKGVPNDVISWYTNHIDGDKLVYNVTLKGPEAYPILEYAENPETRKKMWEARADRLAVNAPLLDKVLELRRNIAVLLGYKTWADYVTEVKMIKSSKDVNDFLDNLEEKLLPIGVKESNALLIIKEKDHKVRNIPYDGQLYVWDMAYYKRTAIKESLSLDTAVVREYFPVSTIVKKLLDIYQRLLGLQFCEVGDMSTWHPDVQAFEVWDKEARSQSDFIGYCYFDLIPRANKPYGINTVFSIHPGYEHSNGRHCYPVVAFVDNIANQTPYDECALMDHFEFATFFREMGHVFHNLLSKTKFYRLHGLDVVQESSQISAEMIQNLCWEYKVLEVVSSHYKTQNALPSDIIAKVIKSRYAYAVLDYLEQVFYAKFDLKVHTSQESEDHTRLWNDMRKKISLVKFDKAFAGQGSFVHITEGYDASCYIYMHSFVIAKDMYEIVFKGDALDPTCGKLFRDKVLKIGGSCEQLDAIKDVLGREPSSSAFVQTLLGNVTMFKETSAYYDFDMLTLPKT